MCVVQEAQSDGARNFCFQKWLHPFGKGLCPSVRSFQGLCSSVSVVLRAVLFGSVVSTAVFFGFGCVKDYVLRSDCFKGCVIPFGCLRFAFFGFGCFKGCVLRF